jgi:hypothetical protein
MRIYKPIRHLRYKSIFKNDEFKYLIHTHTHTKKKWKERNTIFIYFFYFFGNISEMLIREAGLIAIAKEKEKYRIQIQILSRTVYCSPGIFHFASENLLININFAFTAPLYISTKFMFLSI